MFCRIAGVTAAALLISGAAWAQSGTDQSGASSPGSSSGSTMGTQSTTQSGTDTQSSTQGTQTTTTDTQTTTTQTTSTSGTDENRTRLELSAFAGYAFNQSLNLNSNVAAGTTTTNFYNNVGPRDRFTYGASLGYDVTRNLMVGFLWSGQNKDNLQLSNYNQAAATAVGFSATGTGATGTGTAGTGTGTTGNGSRVAAYPVLTNANGASSYQIGTMSINNFHGIVGYEFGPDTALIRPFVYGGAGVTRYGDVNIAYNMMSTTGTGTSARTSSQMVTALLPANSRFSTTWGLGIQIAPYKGLGIRIAGRFTPVRLNNNGLIGPPTATGTPTTTTGTAATGTGATGTGYGTPAATGTAATGAGTAPSVASTSSAWWCNAYSGCATKNYSYQNQWAVTGGITVRF